MRASRRLDWNHGNAERTFFLRRFRRDGWFLKPIDLSDQHENSKRNDNEINYGIDEYAVVDCGDARSFGGFQRRILLRGQADEKVAEIDIAHQFPNGRRQKVGNKRCNDFSKRRADYDADGHVDDVSPYCKFLKFLEHNVSPIIKRLPM